MVLLDTESRLHLDMPRHSSKDVKIALSILRSMFICFNCSSPYIQFAHIKDKPTKLSKRGRGRGKNKRFWDIVAHADSYIPLCFRCHHNYDRRKTNNIPEDVSLLSLYNYYYGDNRNTYKQDDNILNTNVRRVLS